MIKMIILFSIKMMQLQVICNYNGNGTIKYNNKQYKNKVNKMMNQKLMINKKLVVHQMFLINLTNVYRYKIRIDNS